MRAALATLAMVLLSPPALGAGRCPYGGSVTVPVTDFGGLQDPHAAASRSQRLLASLGHCRLFRPDHAGGIVTELATDGGTFRGRTLTLTLIGGATFHSGSPITSDDVVKSWERVQRLDGSSLAVAARALEAEAIDARHIKFTGPAGVEVGEIRALLARPEAAVLRGGRPGAGRGCGPFAVARTEVSSRHLDAFTGHPEGRPWLSRVIAKRIDVRAKEETAFVFGDVDVAFTDVPRARRVGVAVLGGYASYLAVVHPRLRGAEGDDLRRAVVALASQARLSRHVDARTEPATAPWPGAISPTRISTKPPDTMPRLGALVIAYSDGDSELADLARALRDVLRPLASGSARVMAVPNLGLSQARRDEAPSWDIALVRHDWAAMTKAQAALEAAWVFGLGGLSGARVMSRRTRRWADDVAKSASVVAVLHAERPVLYRKALGLRRYRGKLGVTRGGLPVLPEACGPQ